MVELGKAAVLLSYLETVDWLNEFRLIATACLMAAVLVPAATYLWVKCFGDDRNAFARWIPLRWDPFGPRPGGARRRGRTFVCGPGPRIDPRQLEPARVAVSASHVHIFGYPSVDDGTVGFIALEDAAPADFAFLGLDRRRLPDHRHLDQADEDAFCRRLLSLGARVWDNPGHFEFVMGCLDGDETTLRQIVRGQAAVPSAEDQRWVAVAWPSTGGVWVAEAQRGIASMRDDGKLQHFPQGHMLEERGRLKLALDMDEKATILEEYFYSRFYENPKSYGGDAFLPC